MNRYLMLLGVALIVFSVAGGSIEILNGLNQYQNRLHVSGTPGTNPLSVLDEAQWQFARLVGGGIIAGGVVGGSLLMGLAWIGGTLELIRDALSATRTQASVKSMPSSRGA